jgi:DNA-directed RNA polymerase subunit RPC12/RpoP
MSETIRCPHCDSHRIQHPRSVSSARVRHYLCLNCGDDFIREELYDSDMTGYEEEAGDE